jgi:hypothetical protein
MVTVGAVLLFIFPFWESSPWLASKFGQDSKIGTVLYKLALHPLIPLRLLRSRTFSAGCILAFFLFW